MYHGGHKKNIGKFQIDTRHVKFDLCFNVDTFHRIELQTGFRLRFQVAGETKSDLGNDFFNKK